MIFTHIHYTLILPDWKVLQVGGASQPFRRSTHVISPKPFQEKQDQNSWMQSYPEKISENTWVVQDISTTPWPFEDDYFDYVIIGSELVQTRDPVAVCKEMQRVGKRGYIEIPSVVVEHLRDVEVEGVTGYTAHRWFGDLLEDKLRFVRKHPFVHLKKDFWIDNPQISKRPYVNPKNAVNGYFWENSFDVYEENEYADFPDWFFEENIWKYKELTNSQKKSNIFWDISTMIPVILETFPFDKDVLVPINLVPVKFAVSLVNRNGQKHPEILKFEQVLLTSLLRNKNVK